MESKIKLNYELESEANEIYKQYCSDNNVEYHALSAAEFCLGYMVMKPNNFIDAAAERIADKLMVIVRKQLHELTPEQLSVMNKTQERLFVRDESPAGESDAVDWIDVNDRLPEEGGRYWCYVRDLNDLGVSHFQWNCAYNENEKRFSDSTLLNGEQVTHWRPLPEPPKRKQQTT